MDPFNAKLVAAATGSAVTALTMTPFDVIKTRLQTQPPNVRNNKPLFPRPPPDTCCQPNLKPGACHMRNMSSYAARLAQEEVVCVWDHGVFRKERVNGFLDAVRHVWRAEGVSGLWKGAGTSLLIGVPSATTYMLTYDYLLHTALPTLVPSSPSTSTSTSTSALLPLTAGILARTSITTLMSPLELVRTTLQSTPPHPSTPHTLRGTLTTVRALVVANGASHMWRGLGASLWRDVPFSGLYWAGYESSRSACERGGYGRGAGVSFVCGAASGTAAALVTSPFDVLKTRRQALVMRTAVRSVEKRGLGTAGLLRELVRTEGVGALYAGILPRIAKIAPACGIMISCYEGIGRYLAKPS
ncbi:hypothetical protein PLICRDRAFT_35809 [Plicaturopsis crispa FD-325 SS-3]|nr:hypothetical protein PLICRDRAFT_35809 [Plicaturopsis crispa FD-325 SS-3]